MFFVRNMFYLAALFYVLAWITSVFYKKQNFYKTNQKFFLSYLFCMGLTANFFSIAGRYYFSLPLMPMYQTPFFLPFFIGIFSIKLIWHKNNDSNGDSALIFPAKPEILAKHGIERQGMISAVCFLSVIAVFFPNDFYLPFLKSKTIFSHIFFLSGVMAKSCFIIAGIYCICGIAAIKKIGNTHDNFDIRKIPVNENIYMNWIVTGFTLWTISMFSGEIWSFLGWGNPVVWDDAAILTTMATWLYYACFLHLHFLKIFNYQIREYAAVFGVILILVLNFYPDLGIFQMPQISHMCGFSSYFAGLCGGAFISPMSHMYGFPWKIS